MNRIAVLGTDSVAGESFSCCLSRRVKTSGLWFRDPVGSSGGSDAGKISESAINEHAQSCELIVFCGDASCSSWNEGFGRFDIEKQWLDVCLKAAEKHSRPVMFISSDAVFAGPRVFHDDNCNGFDEGKVASELRRLESRVLKQSGSAVIRTNILGRSPGLMGFLDQLISTFESGEPQTLSADAYSTPVSAGHFTKLAELCLTRRATGILNISGAERTTPFRFASALATAMGFDSHALVSPKVSTSATERALRCHRLRTEFGGYPPMLKDLLESLQNEAPAENARTVAA